ncbi:hypothetical protein D3C87_1554530 [compost metagenome]
MKVSSFSFERTEIQFAVRPGSGITNPSDALARISVLKFGHMAIAFLPGEIFVETALEIETNAALEQVMIIGFSENNIGYVPTKTAFNQGGYEIGPGKWSFLEQGAERLIVKYAVRLLGN